VGNFSSFARLWMVFSAWNYKTILGMRFGQSGGKQIICKLTLIAAGAETIRK